MDGRELSSFGDLLRVFRKGKHITQQQLAGRLGLHRNTIGTWEQGEYLPDTRGMVLELARQLHLDEQETRQLLEASLTTLVPYQQALTIYEQQLGPTHPLTGDALNNLAHLYMDQGNYEQAETLHRRALMLYEQRMGQAYPETMKAMEDYHRLIEQQEHAKSLQEIFHQSSSSLSAPLEEVPAGTAQEADPLTHFLDTCCELHPRAWSRASDLWRAYEQWVEEHQQRFPLSRRNFTAQLKAHGCWADRTNTARVWRGIAVMRKDW